MNFFFFPDLIHCSRVEPSCHCSTCGISVCGDISDVLEGSGPMTFKASSGCRLVGLWWGNQTTSGIQTEGRKAKMPTLRQDACLQRILIPVSVIFLLTQGLVISFPEKKTYQTYLIIYPEEHRDLVDGVYNECYRYLCSYDMS